MVGLVQAEKGQKVMDDAELVESDFQHTYEKTDENSDIDQSNPHVA